MKCPKCSYLISAFPDQDPFNFCPKCGKSLKSKAGLQEKPVKHHVGKGEGCVFKRKGQKTYTAVITVASYTKMVDGKPKFVQRRKSKGGFATKREAREYIPVLRELAKGGAPNRKITFIELYEMWITRNKRISHSTMLCYQAAMKKFESIQFYNFTDLRTYHMQDCIDEVPGRRTQENMKTLCGLLYKEAMKRDIVTKNYASYLTVGGTKQPPRQPFSNADLENMWKIVNDDGYDYIEDHIDLVLIMCYTGFRIGEFLDLKVSDFYEKEDWCYFVGGNKTEAGRNRTVGIPPKILPLVRRHLAGKSEYIFSPSGKKISETTFRRKYYYPSLEKHNLPRLTPHSCRHTFATLMKDVSGISTADKALAIGHTSFSMTMHYTHGNEEGLKKLANSL